MNKIVHYEFAARMAQACDGNPKIPPINYGRLGWFVTQFKERFDVTITPETIRKWFGGEARPRHNKLIMLAQIMQVDDAWLTVGRDSSAPSKDQKIVGRVASGVVNLVAGMVQVCGGTPAFPKDSDALNPIDLSAVIRGALYNFNVVLGMETDGQIDFAVSTTATNCLIIAVVRTGELAFDFYELEWETIEERGNRKGAYWHVTEDLDALDTNWRKITTFSERL